MRIKIFILKLIFTLILFSQNSFAKSLPPGAGASDVPANVLILLDVSVSMGDKMVIESSFSKPRDVAVDTNGNIYGPIKDAGGIKKVNYDTEQIDRSFGVNGSFFAPDSNGYLKGTDPWADTLLLRGRIDWGKPQPAYFTNTSLIDFAHLWGTKVMVSIGGWTLSDNFPGIADDPVKTKTLIDNATFI